MAITTYSELQTAIQNWMDDSGLSTYAADFVTLGENRIKRDLRIKQMEKRATASLSTTSRYLELPTGFVALQRFHLQTSPIQEVKYLSKDLLNQYYQSVEGRPGYFTIVGGEFEFNRVADSAYTAEISYYKLVALSGSNTTNEIFPEFAELYHYAALAEATLFTVDPANSTWETKYEIALKKAQTADLAARYPESTLSVRADVTE